MHSIGYLKRALMNIIVAAYWNIVATFSSNTMFIMDLVIESKNKLLWYEFGLKASSLEFESNPYWLSFVFNSRLDMFIWNMVRRCLNLNSTKFKVRGLGLQCKWALYVIWKRHQLHVYWNDIYSSWSYHIFLSVSIVNSCLTFVVLNVLKLWLDDL